MRNRQALWDRHRALSISLLYGPRGALFPMSEVCCAACQECGAAYSVRLLSWRRHSSVACPILSQDSQLTFPQHV